MDAQKIELILFYAIWCPCCRALIGSPDKAWNQLETMYANHPTIKIRKIEQHQFESYENEVTHYPKPQINCFPTIIRVEGKNCHVYDSLDRSVDDFKQFLEESAMGNRTVNTCIIL
jgi:thiol-disulfide isomerase/thioredoxin